MGSSNLMMTPELALVDAPETPARLRLTILPASARTEALALWRMLELELSNQRLACSLMWTQTWLGHYGDLIPHQFAVGMRGHLVCGIALLTHGVHQTVGPFSLDTWHVGTAGEPESDSVCVEYNSLLTGSDDRFEFGDALWRWADEQTRCDEFRLDGFDAPTIQQIALGHSHVHIERKTSYYFDLRQSRSGGEDPIMRLGTHTRANIRKTLRDLDGITGEWAETTESAERLFHQMVQLHQERWKTDGKPGVYSSQRFLQFHTELLSRAIPAGQMGLFGITVANQMVGCCQVLIDNNRGLLYQCGRAAAPQRISLGLALDYKCICECLRRGIDEVDFLAGDSDHKRRLSTNKAELNWVVWRRPNFKNAAIDAIRRIKRTAQQLRSAGRSKLPQERQRNETACAAPGKDSP